MTAFAVGALAMLALASAAPAFAQQATLPEPAVTTITADVATRASVEGSAVQIVRVEEVTWANACLGIETAGEVCAQVLTEGFVAWAQADDVAYRYHVDLTGSNALFAAGDIPDADVPAAELPAGATPRDDSNGGTGGALVSGDIPGVGEIGLLVVTQASAVGDVITELSTGGCTASTLAITSAGAWSVYVVGAPAVVNASFESNFEATTPFFVRCA
jgi:hypothetical protein